MQNGTTYNPQMRTWAAPAGAARLSKQSDRSGQTRVLGRLEWISRMFDDAVRIPYTPVRLGWDAVLGLIPVVGDAATTAVSSYFIWEANRLGVRKRTLVKMVLNVGIDFIVGTVPLVGDLADVGFRANRKNMRLLIGELIELGKLELDEADERVQQLLRRTGHRPARPVPRSLLRWPLLLP